MRFPLHARSPNSAGVLLIAAISGRALAAAARRAGYRPLVADLFCDTDTVAMAERAVKLEATCRNGIDAARLIPTLRRLRRRPTGGRRPRFGFRAAAGAGRRGRQPVSARRQPRRAIRRVKDPQSLAEDCAELGIPHPEFRWQAPPDPENWVVKTTGGRRPARQAGECAELPIAGRYFQRFVCGRSISALFIGDGKRAKIVGFSRQWTSPAPTAPYRYGGAVRLRRFDRREAADRRLAFGPGCTHGLVGLCSADLIRTGKATSSSRSIRGRAPRSTSSTALPRR